MQTQEFIIWQPVQLRQMWQQIPEYFADSPSQQKVLRFLLENGFGISPNGKIAVNGIELSSAAVSRAAGVDRRVVDAAAGRIGEIEELRTIFANLRVTPDFTNVAKDLGLSVITILPKNAGDKNIVASAAGVLASFDLTLRQIFVTDSYAAENPKLVIIIDGKLPAEALGMLRELPAVKSIIL
ncbi:MAG: regulator of amino acid metabolism, contains ACT domain protein [Methanocorpusculum sp.]|nr:regulator of amino acid metabolism, contains ACT domain protein [Methanocorpusculum sp.]